MSKYKMTRYSEPLTEAEVEEIKELLVPFRQREERYLIAMSLRSRIDAELTDFLQSEEIKNQQVYINPERYVELNAKIKESVDDWYLAKTQVFGSDVSADDVWVKVSEDGLYILEYSDFVKEVLTNPDFKTETIQVTITPFNEQLVSEINKYLEKEAQK